MFKRTVRSLIVWGQKCGGSLCSFLDESAFVCRRLFNALSIFNISVICSSISKISRSVLRATEVNKNSPTSNARARWNQLHNSAQRPTQERRERRLQRQRKGEGRREREREARRERERQATQLESSCSREAAQKMVVFSGGEKRT